eukprot:10239560-Alexandrium_andersonii.AAC.1
MTQSESVSGRMILDSATRDHRVPPEVAAELLEEVAGDNERDAGSVGLFAGVRVGRGEDAGGEAML